MRPSLRLLTSNSFAYTAYNNLIQFNREKDYNSWRSTEIQQFAEAEETSMWVLPVSSVKPVGSIVFTSGLK